MNPVLEGSLLHAPKNSSTISGDKYLINSFQKYVKCATQKISLNKENQNYSEKLSVMHSKEPNYA